MTLVAYPLSLPREHAAAASPPRAQGFVDVDERVASGAAGLAVVRAPSRDVADALEAHLARRAASAGWFAIEARTRAGAPLWRDVALRLGIADLPGETAAAAEALAQAAVARRAVVVAPIPAPRTWDRAVATELASMTSGPRTGGTGPLPRVGPAVVLISIDAAPADDLCADVYEVGAMLDGEEQRRWWAALAQAVVTDVPSSSLASLDAWWETARRCPPARRSEAALEGRSRRLATALALVGRTWPVDDAALLDADEGGFEALARSGAARIVDGWVALDPTWEARAAALAEAAAPGSAETAARALVIRFADDPWALARAAELLLIAGPAAEAEAAHVRSLSRCEDATARRELVSRWTAAISALPRAEQLPLRVHAAERALAVGEAAEGFRWAQSAAMLAPADASMGLLFGRAAIALGDLVAAKVALSRAAEHAADDAGRAVVAAEQAEVAYLGGDAAAAEAEARRALDLEPAAVPTRLKARNTLGKLLLAQSRWDEADVHFAQDAWTAAAAGLRTEELRARLNRGIALLSKGFADEARAIFEAVLAEGERIGDARACAFAVENLAVVATLRHDYAQALVLTERTLKLRERMGDRLKTALVTSNLAELRWRLGLLDHAEHAVVFGRRMLGPGMPPSHSAFFSIQAARNALRRGNTVEARREAMRALAESEAAGLGGHVSEAACVSARAAIEDGDVAGAGELLDRARSHAATRLVQAEIAIVTAEYARACGDECERAALEALAGARASGQEDLVIEAHALLAELHRAAGRPETARAHVESAAAMRDQIAATLPPDVRAAFLARPDLARVTRLAALLTEAASQSDLPPPPSSVAASSRPSQASPREIVGDDPAVRGLLAAIRKVARSNSTVLVRGESGTGKELVAEAIHLASDRASGPLVTVNCAALVETLLLSELFGHEKGAFTGAIARRRGRFELADGGTLFLDEIGDISARTQVALLRVLQERTFERVGGTAPIRANVRVICATHRDLRAMVERGEFREDLYYRLGGITLEVPALRARMGDLPRISDHLLARISVERGERKKTLCAEALDLLARHRWPGNVRELENALRAASLFADGDVITAATLLDNIDDLRAAAHAPTQAGRARTAIPAPSASGPQVAAADDDDDVEGEVAVDLPLPANEANATAVAYSQVRAGGMSLPDIKRQIERDCIARALAETRGNITRAAALLGMKRPRLSQLVKQYGLAAVSSEGS